VMLKRTQVFHSRSEHRAAMRAHGFENRVRHVPMPDSDKSRQTTSWESGWPKGYDGRPMCMLSPEEQDARRKEWAE
jgi:hypothetical protein